jgi:hypothetical protein
MSLGADTPYPWCQLCKRWMDESSSLRLKYDAVDTDQVRNLAADLVASQYEHLLEMDQPVEGKDKGLDISVYGCPGCGTAHVMDVRWYRATPDTEHSEVEQMLESAAGTQVVSRLKVPAEIHTHIARLADRAAA